MTQPTFHCRHCDEELDPRDVSEVLEVTTDAWREVVLQAGDGKPVIQSTGRIEDIGMSGERDVTVLGYQCAMCSHNEPRIEDLVRVQDGQPPSSPDQLTITPEGGPTT